MSTRPGPSVAGVAAATHPLAARQGAATGGAALAPLAGPRPTAATASGTTAAIGCGEGAVQASAAGRRSGVPAGATRDLAIPGGGPAIWSPECGAADTPIVYPITTRVGADGRPRIGAGLDAGELPRRDCPASAGRHDQDGPAEGRRRPSPVRGPARRWDVRRNEHFSGSHVILGYGCGTSECSGARASRGGRADVAGALRAITATGPDAPASGRAGG